MPNDPDYPIKLRLCSLLLWFLGLLLHLWLFNWAAVWDLAECSLHLLFLLLGFLKLLEQVFFFDFKLFSDWLSLIGILLCLLNSLVVATFKILFVQVVHSHKMRLSANLIVLNLEEFLLVFWEEVLIVLRLAFIELCLLSFGILVLASVWKERAF